MFSVFRCLRKMYHIEAPFAIFQNTDFLMPASTPQKALSSHKSWIILLKLLEFQIFTFCNSLKIGLWKYLKLKFILSIVLMVGCLWALCTKLSLYSVLKWMYSKHYISKIRNSQRGAHKAEAHPSETECKATPMSNK